MSSSASAPISRPAMSSASNNWSAKASTTAFRSTASFPGFMAQGGDPTGTGTSGSKYPDLKAEFSKEPHVRGTASMARTNAPNSANSQFFICFDDARFLDNQYTVWGNVIEGMEHVDALPKGEPPRAPGKIVKASLRA
jgi:peptidylprolyl isomerase